MVERIRRGGQVAWAVLGLAGLIALVGFLAWVVRVVFPPLIFAGAIVFILNPVVTWLQGRRIPRAGGTALAYLGVVGVLVLAGLLIAPLASRQAQDLSEQWPEVRADIENWVNDISARSKDNNWIIEIPNVQEIQDSFSNNDRSFSDQLATVRDLGLKVFHVVLIFILGPVIAFYLLVDLPHIRKVAESLVPPSARAEVFLISRRLNRAIGGFFRGQLVVAFIVGTLVSIGLGILGLPFWLLVGMIAGIFNIIPLVGPWIGAIPGVVIALTTRDVGTALWVIAIMAAAQQIDNHFITPNVMQRTVKLHPAVVMLALLAGGTLGGFFGLLLAVPVAAVLKILLGHLWRTYVLGEPIEAVAEEWSRDDEQPAVGMVERLADDEVEGDPEADGTAVAGGEAPSASGSVAEVDPPEADDRPGHDVERVVG